MKLIGIAAGVALISSGALGADIRDKGSFKDDLAGVSVQNWSGVYIAGQGGFGTTTVGLEDNQGGISADGGIVGLRAGVDVARGSFLIGAYAEYNWSDEALEFGPVTVIQQEDDWAAMVRIGYIHGRTLFYVAGGYTEVTYSSPAFGGAEATLSGWKGAGGIEHAIAPNLTLALEASYADLDPDDAFAGAADLVDIGDARITGRLTYKINSYTFGF
jgi:opacity protein-like surface antigen